MVPRRLEAVGKVPERDEDVLRVPAEVDDLACRGVLDRVRQRGVGEMGGEETGRGAGGEVREVGGGVMELEKRDEVVGVAGDERVGVGGGDGVGAGGAVEEGEDDGLEPGGAGLGGGDEEDVVELREEVFLAGDDAVEVADGVPEAFILVEVSGEPPVLLWEGGDQVLEFLG